MTDRHHQLERFHSFGAAATTESQKNQAKAAM
jgi:hypothetical protein